MEKLRGDKLNQPATIIQRNVRGWLTRLRLKRLRAAKRVQKISHKYLFAFFLFPFSYRSLIVVKTVGLTCYMPHRYRCCYCRALSRLTCRAQWEPPCCEEWTSVPRHTYCSWLVTMYIDPLWLTCLHNWYLLLGLVNSIYAGIEVCTVNIFDSITLSWFLS